MSQNTTVKAKLSDKWANFMGMFSGNSNPVDTSYATNAGSAGGSSTLLGNTPSGAVPTYGEVLNGASGATPSGASGASGSDNPVIENTQSLVSGLTGSLDTYEKYLQNTQGVYKDIYTENTNFYDQQNKETIAAIEEQQKADLTYAENQTQILINAINQAKESGTKLAKEQYDLLMNMSEEQRQTVYKAAEAQRKEEYRLADIERERGVVDARTSYAQNMATYGANAERMDRMGLTGSGYSDYVNAQAYATQRAETQVANAQSEKAKREARYAENQAKLDADLSYNENQYNAESQYSKDMHDVDTTYAQNLADANVQKNTMIHEAESTARKDTLTANQTAAAGKHEAGMTYRENVLGLDKELTEHRLNEEAKAEAKAEAAETERKNAYLTILSSPGSYSTEDIDALTAEYGFSTEQINSLKTAVERANTKAAEEEAVAEEEALKATSSENYQTIIANIKMDPDYYSDSDLDKMVADSLLTKNDAALAKQLIRDTKAQVAKEDINSIITSGDLGSLTTYLEEAYNGGNGVIDFNTYQDAYFRGALQDCANASGTSEVLEAEAGLKNLKDAGKISSADYDAAVKYMYASQGGRLNSSSYTATIKNGTAHIDLDGKTYSTNAEISYADEYTSKVLAGIAGGETPVENTLVMYDGKLYMSRGEYWIKLKDKNGLYSKYNTLCSYQAGPTVPKHTAQSNTPSSSSQASNYALRGRDFE